MILMLLLTLRETCDSYSSSVCQFLKLKTKGRQCRRLHMARGGGTGHVSPNFSKWLGTGTMNRTANRKLTKLYCPSQKCSPKTLIVLVCRAKKVKEHDKKISGALCRTCAPFLNVFPRHFRAANLTTATDGQRSCYATEPNIRLRRFVDEFSTTSDTTL